MPYVDHPTIRFNAKESVEMPFRTSIHQVDFRTSPKASVVGYIADEKGQPILPQGMKELLKVGGLYVLSLECSSEPLPAYQEDLNKGFDF